MTVSSAQSRTFKCRVAGAKHHGREGGCGEGTQLLKGSVCSMESRLWPALVDAGYFMQGRDGV